MLDESINQLQKLACERGYMLCLYEFKNLMHIANNESDDAVLDEMYNRLVSKYKELEAKEYKDV